MTEQILVIKHGALGDIIQGFDAFESLRQHKQNAHIALLTGHEFADFMRYSGWFDEILIDRRVPILNVTESWRTLSMLRRKWDKVIDLQCSRRTEKYARLISSGTRWFGTARGASDPMPDFAGINNRDRMMVAVEQAGAQAIPAQLNWLLSAELPDGVPKRYCILIAGCSPAKPSKRWPPDAFATVARRALAKGITPMLTGTAADAEVNQYIGSVVPEVFDMTSRTSLFQLAVLARQAVFVLGNDTGPVFLAARAGAPTWMLMGPDTDPSMSAPIGAKADWLRASPLDTLDAGFVCATIGLE